MGKAPAFQFYVMDWVGDTAVLSPAARGIWIDLLCAMWRAEVRGRVQGLPVELARVARCSVEEFVCAVGEFERHKTCDVSRVGHGVVTLVSRRMIREEKTRDSWRDRKQKERSKRGGVSRVSRKCHAPSSSSSSSSPPVPPLGDGCAGSVLNPAAEADAAWQAMRDCVLLRSLSFEAWRIAKQSWVEHPEFERVASAEFGEALVREAVLMGSIAAPGAWVRRRIGALLDGDVKNKETGPAELPPPFVPSGGRVR